MEWGIAVEELGATGGGAAPVSAGIGPSNGGGPPFGKPPGIDGGCPSGEEVAKEPMPGGVPMPAPGEGFARGGIGPSSGLLCEGGGGAPIGLDGGCGLDESDGGALSGSGLPLRDGGPDGWPRGAGPTGLPAGRAPPGGGCRRGGPPSGGGWPIDEDAFARP